MILEYHEKQAEFLFKSQARRKAVAKGRRFGFTKGVSNYAMQYMASKRTSVLWIDTVNSNIERYVERYYLPELAQLDRDAWTWKKQQKTLHLGESYMDMRSADQPELIEGFGYDLIIINEAGIVLKDRYLWYNTILPMTLDYSGRMIVGGTPKGRKDKKQADRYHVFYELFQKGTKGEGGWESFHYTSYDNPMLTKVDIDELSQEVAPSVRDQEINAQFVDINETPIYNRAWWNHYNVAPDGFQRVVQSWDTAHKKSAENDYNVCTTWGVLNGNYYLLDWSRSRMVYPELKRKAVALWKQWGADVVLIEDKASGQDLIADLKAGTGMNIVPVTPVTDKVARAHSSTPPIEAGRVLIPAHANWRDTYEEVMQDFPSGLEDDTIDSTSQALRYLEGGSGPAKYESVVRRKSFDMEPDDDDW